MWLWCRVHGGGPFAQQILHAPCDRRRRVEPLDWPGRKLAQAREQQRIVRAGEHYGVGTPAVSIREAWINFGGDLGIVRRIARKFSFRETGEPRRADEAHVATGRKLADQRAGIFAAYSRLRA